MKSFNVELNVVRNGAIGAKNGSIKSFLGKTVVVTMGLLVHVFLVEKVFILTLKKVGHIFEGVLLFQLGRGMLYKLVEESIILLKLESFLILTNFLVLIVVMFGDLVENAMSTITILDMRLKTMKRFNLFVPFVT